MGIRFWKWLYFWNCVGGVHLRGCFSLKIDQCVCLFMLIVLICKIRGTFWFHINSRNFNPRNFQFLVSFLCVGFVPCGSLWRRWYQKTWIFFWTFFIQCQKSDRGCPPNQTPTQKIKSKFFLFGSQEIV